MLGLFVIKFLIGCFYRSVGLSLVNGFFSSCDVKRREICKKPSVVCCYLSRTELRLRCPSYVFKPVLDFSQLDRVYTFTSVPHLQLSKCFKSREHKKIFETVLFKKVAVSCWKRFWSVAVLWILVTCILNSW